MTKYSEGRHRAQLADLQNLMCWIPERPQQGSWNQGRLTWAGCPYIPSAEPCLLPSAKYPQLYCGSVLIQWYHSPVKQTEMWLTFYTVYQWRRNQWASDLLIPPKGCHPLWDDHPARPRPHNKYPSLSVCSHWPRPPEQSPAHLSQAWWTLPGGYSSTEKEYRGRNRDTVGHSGLVNMAHRSDLFFKSNH